MKIVFLQLSDLHLQDNQGVYPAKIQAIVDSLAVYAPFEGIVIIFSGDIAATGENNQYKIASTFLGRLVPTLKDRYSIGEKNTKILMVPGNHDIDWGGKSRLDSAKIRAFTDTEKEKHLQHEIRCMKNFFSFQMGTTAFLLPMWNLAS